MEPKSLQITDCGLLLKMPRFYPLACIFACAAHGSGNGATTALHTCKQLGRRRTNLRRLTSSRSRLLRLMSLETPSFFLVRGMLGVLTISWRNRIELSPRLCCPLRSSCSHHRALSSATWCCSQSLLVPQVECKNAKKIWST